MVRENQKQQVQGKVGLGQLYAALGMVLESSPGSIGMGALRRADRVRAGPRPPLTLRTGPGFIPTSFLPFFLQFCLWASGTIQSI